MREVSIGVTGTLALGCDIVEYRAAARTKNVV